MKYVLSFLVIGFLAACGDGKKEAAEAAEDPSLASAWTIDLAEHDMPLEIDLGDKSTLGVDSFSVVWNEEFGELRVNAGDRFALAISEEPGDIPRLKADLDRDMLRKHTVIDETPDKVVYRSQFPDEDLVFVHFYRVVQVGDRSFVVQDAPEGRFNEADVQRMVGSVRSKQAS
ncbi:MAG: hypothetical protein R2818_02695 [Flavobacteriales bacterium]